MVGSVGSRKILRSYVILHDIRSYIWSYHFCDPATILNFLVRWDRKIVRFYDPDRDFDNHGCNTYNI